MSIGKIVLGKNVVGKNVIRKKHQSMSSTIVFFLITSKLKFPN